LAENTNPTEDTKTVVSGKAYPGSCVLQLCCWSVPELPVAKIGCVCLPEVWLYEQL